MKFTTDIKKQPKDPCQKIIRLLLWPCLKGLAPNPELVLLHLRNLIIVFKNIMSEYIEFRMVHKYSFIKVYGAYRLIEHELTQTS